jgi:hypothetical protein
VEYSPTEMLAKEEIEENGNGNYYWKNARLIS